MNKKAATAVIETATTKTMIRRCFHRILPHDRVNTTSY